MSKTRIGVVFGGQNTEHHVSCASAAGVLANLRRDRYEPVPVRIAEDGTWRVATAGEVPAGLDAAGLIALTSGTDDDRAGSMAAAIAALGSVDVIFPVLHGVLGEDGAVQGLFDLLGVPYVGCGVPASAVGMDKEFTKTVLRAEGITVADGVVLREPGETLTELDRKRFGLPVFVKPNSGGSSIGITRVAEWAGLDAAVAEAFRVDTKVLVEPAVAGREVGISVLEHPDGRVATAPPVESRMDAGRHTFLDHAAKYEDSTTSLRIPADVSPAVAAALAEMATVAFRVLGCVGLVRVDFFVHVEGGETTIVLNEVNTLPGLTPASQFPAAWAKGGLAYPELLDVLVDTALARGVRRRTPTAR